MTSERPLSQLNEIENEDLRFQMFKQKLSVGISLIKHSKNGLIISPLDIFDLVDILVDFGRYKKHNSQIRISDTHFLYMGDVAKLKTGETTGDTSKINKIHFI